MASGNVLFGWGNAGAGNMPPTSAAAVPDTIDINAGLSYAKSNDGNFPIWVPDWYSGGGFTLKLAFAPVVGGSTSGNVQWQAQWKRHAAGDDISSMTFSTAVLFSSAALTGATQIVYASQAFTSGSQINSLTTLDHGILRVTRNTTSDTVTSNVLLVGWLVTET